MISILYKADLPRNSERTIKGIPIDYNVPPVTEIDGYIDDVTTTTDMSIIKTTPESPFSTKAAMR